MHKKRINKKKRKIANYSKSPNIRVAKCLEKNISKSCFKATLRDKETRKKYERKLEKKSNYFTRNKKNTFSC